MSENEKELIRKAKAAYKREYEAKHPGRQAEYAKKWRKRNPGKQAEYTRRYWIRKGLQMEEGATKNRE